jgi:hypothetical protein
MIDPTPGTLTFGDPPIQIPLTLTRTQFRAADWAQGATTQTANEPWLTFPNPDWRVSVPHRG